MVLFLFLNIKVIKDFCQNGSISSRLSNPFCAKHVYWENKKDIARLENKINTLMNNPHETEDAWMRRAALKLWACWALGWSWRFSFCRTMGTKKQFERQGTEFRLPWNEKIGWASADTKRGWNLCQKLWFKEVSELGKSCWCSPVHQDALWLAGWICSLSKTVSVKLCAWRGSVEGQWHLRESTTKPLNRERSMEKEEREKNPQKQIPKTFHSKLCLHTRVPKYMLRKTSNKNQQLEHEFSKNEVNFIKPEDFNRHLKFLHRNTYMNVNRTERNVLRKDGYGLPWWCSG